MKIENKQQLLKIIKQEHMMKTFIIITYVLINRNFGTTHDGVIKKIIEFYPTDKQLIKWIKEWRITINSYIKRDLINFKNLKYHTINV